MTDGPTDRRVDRRRHTPSYRDARTHLKRETERKTQKQNNNANPIDTRNTNNEIYNEKECFTRINY